jgi:hypothetical protein
MLPRLNLIPSGAKRAPVRSCRARLLGTLSRRLVLLLALLGVISAAVIFVYEYEWCFANLQPGTPPKCPAWLNERYPPTGVSKSVDALVSSRNIYGEDGASSALPFFDIVLLVPTPIEWGHRRRDVRRAFARTAARLPQGLRAALVFVVGGRGETSPGATVAGLSDAAEGDIIAVDCADLDGPGGWVWPTSDSATTCKVIEGMRAIVSRYRFHFFARIGDDAFFKFDAFLLRVGAQHVRARENLVFAYWVQGNRLGDGPLQASLGGPPGLPLTSHGPYPGGMAYILGYNITAGLAAVADRVGLVDAAPEDVIVGALHALPLTAHRATP